MYKQSFYKSPEGKAKILALYDGFLNKLDVEYEERTVDTRFEATHVLVFGPEHV